MSFDVCYCTYGVLHIRDYLPYVESDHSSSLDLVADNVLPRIEHKSSGTYVTRMASLLAEVVTFAYFWNVTTRLERKNTVDVPLGKRRCKTTSWEIIHV